MGRYLDEKEKELIIELHLQNKNTVEIAKALNRNQSTIERFLKKNGYKMNYGSRISKEQKEEIKNMYLSGKTCKEIYNEFKHIYNCEESIQKLIREMGISRGRYKKPTCLNDNYFETIDTEHKAYWIGFLLADGCVTRQEGKSDTIKLELKVEDKYIIEEFAKDIGTDLSVKDYKYGKKHNAQVQVKSNKMSNDLKKYGITYNKTFKIDGLPNIPSHLIRHLIRGYFDGDGCITLYKPKDQNIHRAKVIFCGTKDFLNSLNHQIHQDINLNLNDLIDMNKYGNNVFNLRYIRNEDIYKLYEYMYEGATVFLTRKKDKFLQFINERK